MAEGRRPSKFFPKAYPGTYCRGAQTTCVPRASALKEQLDGIPRSPEAINTLLETAIRAWTMDSQEIVDTLLNFGADIDIVSAHWSRFHRRKAVVVDKETNSAHVAPEPVKKRSYTSTKGPKGYWLDAETWNDKMPHSLQANA